MVPNEAINFPPAPSLEEDNDENEDLKEFYESNLPLLKECSWDLISYTVLRRIAVQLNETKSSNEEWRKYAEEMGIDNRTMSEIKATAYCHRELEIFFAMDKIARQRLTFGHIIRALLKTERFDVLRDLVPFVKSILSKIPQRQTGNSNSSVPFGNENDTTIFFKNSTPFCEQKCELMSSQLFFISSCFKNDFNISCTPINTKESLEETIEKTKVHFIPVEVKITILNQQTESKKTTAEELSSQSTCQGMFDGGTRNLNEKTMEQIVTISDIMFHEVHFIVLPVLSEKFTKEMDPENFEEYFKMRFIVLPVEWMKFREEMDPEDLEEYFKYVYGCNNRSFRKLNMHDTTYNRCIIIRVWPVVVNGSSHMPIKEPVRLPNEIRKLSRVKKKKRKRN